MDIWSNQEREARAYMIEKVKQLEAELARFKPIGWLTETDDFVSLADAKDRPDLSSGTVVWLQEDADDPA